MIKIYQIDDEAKNKKFPNPFVCGIRSIKQMIKKITNFFQTHL
jgi:hypothetical protein